MSVRKRKWTTAKGERKESWVVDYFDQNGERHIETFSRKKDADERHATIKVDVRRGVHTAASKSIVVAEAAEDWIEYVTLEGRERSTIAQYRQHVDLHINPRLGREKLPALTTPRINEFRDDLLKNMSRAMARKVLTSLKSLLRDAQRRGNVAQNAARDISIGKDKRGKRKLKIGVDIPTPGEIKQIVHVAAGHRWRSLLLTAIFTGLRGSELRGLRWQDVDLKAGEIHVCQRADRYNKIGKLKSESGERFVPLGPLVLSALKEWRLACPKSQHGLVFPTSRGNIIRHENIIRQALVPVQLAAGLIGAVSAPLVAGRASEEGREAQPVAKYTGLHALRHFYASWCINRRVDGGLELPPKVVQERLGHASIVITMDTYGHLFPRGDDGAELAAAERALLA
jgi:integrase